MCCSSHNGIHRLTSTARSCVDSDPNLHLIVLCVRDFEVAGGVKQVECHGRYLRNMLLDVTSLRKAAGNPIVWDMTSFTINLQSHRWLKVLTCKRLHKSRLCKHRSTRFARRKLCKLNLGTNRLQVANRLMQFPWIPLYPRSTQWQSRRTRQEPWTKEQIRIQ